MQNNKYLQPQKDERPVMIIAGIWTLYIVLTAFFIYLFFLHRINLFVMLISVLIITVLHIPRFLIIKKMKMSDKIKIIDDEIFINERVLRLSDICDFALKEKKPNVIFFLNNRMIIYQEAHFILKTTGGDVCFDVVGSEKTALLKEFFEKLLSK